MRADLLHVVTCVANPVRWESRIRLARDFIAHMKASGVRLTVVECAYGERPHELSGIDGIRHVPVRANTMAWSKESLLNIGIRALPWDAKYVAWIDADVVFRRADWAAETVHALQIVPVVQTWSEALDLGPRGEIMTVEGQQVFRCFAQVWREHPGELCDRGYFRYHHSHCGYAWAARMDALNAFGLLMDRSGAGAADHQMAMGMVGRIDGAIHGGCTDSYKAFVRAWGRRAFAVVQGHIGYVPGRIEHFFHGAKHKRQYLPRWEFLIRHGFDPLTDVHPNRWGVLELSTNKPELRRAVEAYFHARDEDDNTI